MPEDARSVWEEGEYPHPGPRLEPDLVLPVQFFRAGRGTLQPEKRLMLAVLEDAVATFLARRGGRQAWEEVERWFASSDDASPFAFVRICHALGFDAGCLRGGLARARGKRLSHAFRRIAGARHAIGGSP